LPLKYMDTLEATSPDLILEQYVWDNALELTLRCDKGPTEKLEVRRALWIATDLEEIRDAVYMEGDAKGYPVAKGSVGWTPLEERSDSIKELYEYDPVKAKQMLADAGYPDGFDFEITLKSGSPDWEDVATMLADMWSEIGVTVTLNSMEQAAWVSALFAYSWGEGFMHDWGGDFGPCEDLKIIVPPPYGFGINIAMYDHDEDPYLEEQYLKADSTPNSTERHAIWKALNAYYLEQVTHIWFPQPYGLHAWWPWVQNYYGEIDVGHLNPVPIIARLWIDEDLKAELGY
ncbi:MAG: hypothetical protein KAS19_00710, partial [Anaerolineales bacterium]|nr:hypothetical protein [Anaerolineales bacterium]